MNNSLLSSVVVRSMRIVFFGLVGLGATFVGVNWLFGLPPVQPIMESWGGIATGPRIAIGFAQSLGALAYWIPRTQRLGSAMLALMLVFFSATNFFHDQILTSVIDLAILGLVGLAGYLGHPARTNRGMADIQQVQSK
ncbi:MAG: hypothetical protein ING73_11780 [Rhodocyclaceae bacterium]|jgi:hypothetical protein|nr:hypothetical protein [Rhodocyclaceae bacterium]MCA3050561.1 hypothetical protein [Rhodocyclaceae bacterium]MCA3054976.1 hypothetical protein [Rhodocyclaceae bacterium]MCA3060834.1 hypothetical protein [Rhodocyclaceae bacterium]MCA3063985.1 hypothetical protein [Rhodocyclaceae bacterium]